MIAVTSHASGAILPVWAKPGSKTNALDDTREGAVVVSVTAVPESGKANEAIIEVLAKTLNLRRAQFEIISGATSRNKRVLVTGVRPEELIARVEAALTPTIYDPSGPDV
jgi:uncharacterized protein (TIGR00251 family)